MVCNRLPEDNDSNETDDNVTLLARAAYKVLDKELTRVSKQFLAKGMDPKVMAVTILSTLLFFTNRGYSTILNLDEEEYGTKLLNYAKELYTLYPK